MAEYLPALHGVSYSEAYAEAITAAPIYRALVETLEMRHSGFVDDAGAPYAIRVANDFNDFTAGLEWDAPMDPSATVAFAGLPIEISGPDETDEGAAPAITIAIDGVSGHILPQLDRAVQTLEPVAVTYRVYASDDTSEPAMRPVLHMTLRDVVVGETRITARATFGDPANRGFPRRDYQAAQYPGLTA